MADLPGSLEHVTVCRPSVPSFSCDLDCHRSSAPFSSSLACRPPSTSSPLGGSYRTVHSSGDSCLSVASISSEALLTDQNVSCNSTLSSFSSSPVHSTVSSESVCLQGGTGQREGGEECSSCSGDGCVGVWSSSCHSDSGLYVSAIGTSSISDTDAGDGGSMVLMDLPDLLLSADDSSNSWFQQQQQRRRESTGRVPLSGTAAAVVPDGDAELSQSSTFSEEILYNQDLTLDKAAIARDLLGECDTSCRTLHAPVSPQLSHCQPYRSALISAADCDVQQLISADSVPCVYPSVPLGSEHQACVSGLLPQSGRELETASFADTLLWDCHVLPEAAVAGFLGRYARQNDGREGSSWNDGPLPSNPPDCEHALSTLQRCGHDVSLALQQQQCGNRQVSPAGSGSYCDGHELSEEDVFNFEAGLRLFGKNFARIRRFKLPQRSVGELVRFYYRWKKQRPQRYAAILPKFVDKRKHILRCTTVESVEPGQSVIHHSLLGEPSQEDLAPSDTPASPLVSSVRLVVKRATSPSLRIAADDCMGSTWSHSTDSDEVSSLIYPPVIS
uniref:Mier1-like protein n=1 Tax=Parasacculina yatsui TaxID=2836420 RepID=A0A8K1VED8_9CRUS|nr:Mier1-like protein [Parasacculina yatsui]